jgi:uncharacterized tellurite resistance protein B-like protein
MESIAYQKILLRTAMCVMACDGEIHASEVKEIELAFEQTDFFKGLVFKEEMDSVINEFKRDEKKIVKECFDQLASADLNSVQQLQVLEIVLRIIYADERVDENEVKFLKIVKSLLGVPDEIIFKRFGYVSCLGGKYSTDKLIPTADDFLSDVKLPEIQEMAKMIDGVKAKDNSDAG